MCLVSPLEQWVRISPVLGLCVIAVASTLVISPAREATERSAVPVVRSPRLSAPTPTSRAVGLARAWEPTGFQGVTVRTIAVDVRHPGHVFAGTDTGLYHWDGAIHWQHVLRNDGVTSALVLPDARTVVAAGHTGVYVSRDGGAQWRWHGVTHTGVFSLVAQPGNPRRLVAGGGDGLYLSVDGGRHWSRRLRLRHVIADSLSWQPGSRRIAFSATTDADATGGPTGVLVTRDAGWSWQPFGMNRITAPGVMAVLATRTAIFAGSMGHGVWRAHIGAPTWRLIPKGMPSFSGIRAFEVHGAALISLPSRPSVLYVGTVGHGVYRTVDDGQHWTSVSRGLLASRSANVVLALAYDASRHTLYAGTDDGVYELDGVGG